jgi:negative regulator of flagellin synthesis FlgM
MIDVRIARPAEKPATAAGYQSASKAPAAQSAVFSSSALDPGSAPVDVERISLIRQAVEKGDYPLIPARVADAMIAAGMLLRSAK